MWNYVTPQLPVVDLDETERFYRDVLECEVIRLRGDFATARLGRVELFLQKVATRKPGSVCCIRVDDADALHGVYAERGAKIVSAPETKPWGMREFTLEVPNGHRFRFGHSTR
jgi:catechol 2,3-dioxygenase-like lactoylglutathione lyase family enzyme